MADDRNINNNDDDEIQVLTLEFEDDTKMDCGVVAIFSIEDQDYIAVAEVDENNEFKDDMEVMLFRYYQDENDENAFRLGDIEDEEEMNMVQQVFEQIMNDELDEDEDEADDDEAEYTVYDDNDGQDQSGFRATSDDAMVQDILNRIIRDKKY